ncbi:hypothetical protein ABFS83_05G095200 [Erythranthe nasuta]
MELNASLLAIIILISTYIVFNIKKLLIKKKKQKLPPGPNGLPIIGSLVTIGGRTHESIANLAETYGPLMTLRLGFVNVVVASSAETVKEILHTHEMEFIGRPIPDAATAENGYELALPWLSVGPHWKKLRKICNAHLFTPLKLDLIQELRNQVMRNMTERLFRAQEGGKVVEIKGLAFSTIVQLMSNSMFSDDLLDPASGAMEELEMLNGNIMVLLGKPNFADYFPFLRLFDLQGIRREIRKSYDRLHGLIDGIIDIRTECRRMSGGSDRVGDFLDVLLDYMEDEGPQGLTRLDIKLMITELFIGGTDSSTTTVEWAMTELIRNPNILSKLRQELSEKITNGKTVQEQDLPRLPYLTAVIKETMRLHPPSPLLLPRRAEQEVEIHGFTIPKNTRIWLNVLSITRDPKSWEGPTTCFVPERFLDSDIDFRGRVFSFIPFSSGRRICPGMNLGLRMVSLILATLVQKFDWKLPNEMAPEDMDMTDRFGLTLRKAQPLVLIPTKL